jgi:hypothetical protein
LAGLTKQRLRSIRAGVFFMLAVFVYSIWDSYRCAVEINKSHSLAEIEDAPITPSADSFFDVMILEKKHPWVGLVWSALCLL